MQIDERRWYQKKRYVIASGVIGATAVLGLTGEPESQPVTSSVVQEISRTAAQPQILPVAKSPVQPSEPDIAEKAKCNSNYSGCLLVGAGDYDCLGGSGNGPNYTGTVHVSGFDEYGLDRDGDGTACE